MLGREARGCGLGHEAAKRATKSNKTKDFSESLRKRVFFSGLTQK